MTFTLLLLSALVGLAGLYPYIRDTVRGRVRPRLVSWSVWTILAGIMTVSALMDGHFASAALSAQGFFECGLVVIFGWRQGNIRISRLDILSVVGAGFGLASLIFLHDPGIALIVSVIIDAVAFMPTLVHAWTDPDEESIICYACAIGASSLALVAAVGNGAGFTGLFYPIYSVLFNGLMALLLVASRPSLEAIYDYENG